MVIARFAPRVRGGTSRPGGEYYASSYMVAPPGTAFKYSSFGFALLGYLVENISDTPFDVYTSQNIFEPLGMDSTGWHLADLGSATIAMPYRCNHNSSGGKSTLVCHALGNTGIRTTLMARCGPARCSWPGSLGRS